MEGASFAGLTLKDVPRGTAQSGVTMGDERDITAYINVQETK